MSNLEHNIKEAFATQDAKTKFAGKDTMWDSLDKQMGKRSGVAAFWRVAAILLGVFLLTGAFAALNYSAQIQNELDKMELGNARLIATNDSLLSLPTTTQTEIQIVEKEKIVYRDRPSVQQNTDLDKLWEKKYNQLADSTELVLANNKEINQQMNYLRTELAAVKKELDTKEQEKRKQSAPFELKSERIDVDISKKPSVKNPDIKMKVFQKNFIENRNNLNSTIFKK